MSRFIVSRNRPMLMTFGRSTALCHRCFHSLIVRKCHPHAANTHTHTHTHKHTHCRFVPESSTDMNAHYIIIIIIMFFSHKNADTI